MSTNYPTTKQSIPNPASTDLLENATASLDHDYQHGTANDTIEALQDKVGVDGSAVTTSHDYKLSEVTGTDKAVGKTATQVLTNKTLTSPQINFGSDARGDLMVRNSSGVSSRLPIGTSGQILSANASGDTEWIANPAASDASTTVKGVIELATTAEINAGTATGATGAKLAVTPDALIASNYVQSSTLKFGGSGADGALTISSGTTTLDLGGAQFYEKNYSSISITGTGSLAFTNPHANGTIITIKCKGDCTLTSSNPSIDTTGMGAAGGAQITTINADGNDGNLPTTSFYITQTGAAGGKGKFGGATPTAGAQYVSSSIMTRYSNHLSLYQGINVGAGAGGGSGSVSSVSGTGGAGGNGGGGLYMEIYGAINFTGSIKLNGSNGAAGVGNGGSGGGGGAAGTAVVLYNTSTSLSGTFTATGGAGATSVNAGYSNTGGAGGGSALGAGGTNSAGGDGGNGTLGSGGSGSVAFGGTPHPAGTGGTGGLTFISKNYWFS